MTKQNTMNSALASNHFVGVYDSNYPIHRLQALGIEPIWHDARVAFGGASAYVDETTGVVIAGEAILNNAPALQKLFEAPTTEPLELLIKVYARQGLEGFRAVYGMFAVALWEPRANCLTLIRDGVGARTMYYAVTGNAVLFATRLKTLKRTGTNSENISLTALRKYLTFGYVPGAETMFQDVMEVRPGTAIQFPEKRVFNYWEPKEGNWSESETLQDYAARLRTLLEQTVAECLPPRAPVGVFLSGGIDSSLITALAARQHSEPVHTFSIHFGKEYPNELEFSDLVAKHCNTKHHVLEISAAQIQASLPETIRALDDPIGDPLTVPNFLLGRLAKEHADCILNGEGGDPIFGGPKNAPMLLHSFYGNETREQAYLRAYQKCYEDLEQLLTPAVQSKLKEMEPQEAILAPFFENADMPHYLNKLLHINIRLKGADHILTKVNNLTTANQLFGFSPLFDPRVVDLSLAIPPEYKLQGSIEKAVLKQSAADLLPQVILTRPKSGMLVPVQAWFRRDLKKFASEMLLGRDARIRPYIETSVIKNWLAYRDNLFPRHGVKLWLLLTLEVWLRENQ